MEEKTEYRISDEVWHRVVQIVQEAMLTGIDCVDLLRQVRVKPELDMEEGPSLYLTEGYRTFVKEYHQKLLDEAAQKQAEANAEKLVKVVS